MTRNTARQGMRIVCPRHFDRHGRIDELFAKPPRHPRPWAWIVFDDAPNERLAVWLHDLQKEPTQRQSEEK